MSDEPWVAQLFEADQTTLVSRIKLIDHGNGVVGTVRVPVWDAESDGYGSLLYERFAIDFEARVASYARERAGW